MPNTSYDVESIHFEGSPVFKGIRHVSSDKIKSMQSKYKMSTFSFEKGEPFYNIDGDKVVFRTSGNDIAIPRVDFDKYGGFYSKVDWEMDRWKAAGEDAYSSLFEEVPDYFSYLSNKLQASRNQFVVPGYMQGIKPLRMHFPNPKDTPKDTPVNLYTTPNIDKIEVDGIEIHFALPANLTGYFASKDENFRQALKNSQYDFRELHRGKLNPEAESWMQFLWRMSHKNPKMPIGHGVWYAPFIAATLPLKKDYAYLMAGIDFDEQVDRIMERDSLTGRRERQLVRDYILFHEYSHLFPKGHKNLLGRWKIEHDRGVLQRDFFRERAALLEGKDIGDIYRVLEKIAGDYAKRWSFWSTIKAGILSAYSKLGDKSGEDLEALVDKYESEAIALGLAGDEIAGYVSRKIAECRASRTQRKSGETEEVSEIAESGLESKLSSYKSKGRKGEDSKNLRTKGKERSEKDMESEYSELRSKMHIYETGEETDNDDNPDDNPNESDESENAGGGQSEGSSG